MRCPSSILPRSFRNKIVYSNKPTNYSENSAWSYQHKHNSDQITAQFLDKEFLIFSHIHILLLCPCQCPLLPSDQLMSRKLNIFCNVINPHSHSLCKSVETEKVESPALIKNQYDSNNAPSC